MDPSLADAGINTESLTGHGSCHPELCFLQKGTQNPSWGSRSLRKLAFLSGRKSKMHVCVYSLHIYIDVYVDVYVYVNVPVNVYAYVVIYIYIHTHTHTSGPAL